MKKLTIFNQNYQVKEWLANAMLNAKNRKVSVAVLLADGLINGNIIPIK
jgi:hypothetical protein